jgi:hypothetical protein
MGKQEHRQVLGPRARLTASTVALLRLRSRLLVPRLMAVLLLGHCAASAADQASTVADNPEAVTLPVTVHGSWQVIQLPLNWRRKYLKEPRPREVAVALMGPSAADIGADNAPCGPPQSVVLIATNDSGRTRTKVLHKGEYCSSHWHPPVGLSWAVGPRIAIESVAVAIRANGDLDITYMMKRDVGHSDDPSSNSELHGNWKDTLPLAQIQRLVDAR